MDFHGIVELLLGNVLGPHFSLQALKTFVLREIERTAD
jgi:hypothetical protein